MYEHEFHENSSRPAGYQALTERFKLDVIPNWHISYVSQSNTRRVETRDRQTIETFPSTYWPGEKPCDHLEFALKYDGTNLAILASLFHVLPEGEFQEYVESKPRGKYARRLWYLYELLTGKTIPIDDLKTGGYIDLLEPSQYITTASSSPVRRQRINDNLLGDARFCPTVRLSDKLREFSETDLADRCKQVMSAYPPELLKRALSYLYSKETKASFEIENVTPSSTRTERFIALLQLAEKKDFCEKTLLIELQNRVVDPRFRNYGYREVQNYIGETIAPQREKVHYACPKPRDLAPLMEGLLSSHACMEAGGVHPVVHAAVVAYGFVFLHPFEDGNGRIHRFLIHNILVRRGFTPEGIMFPVSASMLKNSGEYDASLEAFSRPLMSLVEYKLDEAGRMTVTNDTNRWYAFIDMTAQVEALFRFIERTIETELVEELSFLVSYDEAKKKIQAIVDMPDRQLDMFIRFCLQNNGRLSSRKRESHFDFLDDDEVARMEEAVQVSYGTSAG